MNEINISNDLYMDLITCTKSTEIDSIFDKVKLKDMEKRRDILTQIMGNQALKELDIKNGKLEYESIKEIFIQFDWMKDGE